MYLRKSQVEFEHSVKSKRSNCLIQAVVRYVKSYPHGKIGYDYNSPNRSISFYCNVNKEKQFRFRRIKEKNNTNKFFFKGKVVIIKIK